MKLNYRFAFKLTARDGTVSYGRVDSAGVVTFDVELPPPAVLSDEAAREVAEKNQSVPWTAGPERRIIWDGLSDGGTTTWYGGESACPTACDACADAGTCRRLNQCLRYKCGFGEVDKP